MNEFPNSVSERVRACLEDKEMVKEIGILLRNRKVIKEAVSELHDEVKNRLSLDEMDILDWVNQSLPHSLGIRQHRHGRGDFWVYDTFDYNAPYYEDVVTKIARKVRISEEEVQAKLSEQDYFQWVEESLQGDLEDLDIDGNTIRLYGPEGGRVDPDIEMLWDGGGSSLWLSDSWVQIDKKALENEIKRVKPEALLKYVLEDDNFDEVIEDYLVVQALVDYLYLDDVLDVTDVLTFSKKGEKAFRDFAKLISNSKKSIKSGDFIVDNIIANLFDR